jgi:hypothetical protein
MHNVHYNLRPQTKEFQSPASTTPTVRTAIWLCVLALEQEQSRITEHPSSDTNNVRKLECSCKLPPEPSSKRNPARISLTILTAPEGAQEEHLHYISAGLQSKDNMGILNRIGQGHRNSIKLLLLLILGLLGVAQGLSDCEILEEWIPDIFAGTTSCCSHFGIRCSGDRIKIRKM